MQASHHLEVAGRHDEPDFFVVEDARGAQAEDARSTEEVEPTAVIRRTITYTTVMSPTNPPQRSVDLLRRILIIQVSQMMFLVPATIACLLSLLISFMDLHESYAELVVVFFLLLSLFVGLPLYLLAMADVVRDVHRSSEGQQRRGQPAVWTVRETTWRVDPVTNAVDQQMIQQMYI